MKRVDNGRTILNKVCFAFILAAAIAGCRLMSQSSGMETDAGRPGDASAIVARIDGQPLAYNALVRQYNLYFTLSGDFEEYQQEVSLEEFLDRYILEILLLQEAKGSGIRVSPEALEAERAVYLEGMGLSEEALSEKLVRVGLGMADADRFFENNRVIDKWSRVKFKDLSVSNEEALAFYNDNPDFFYKATGNLEDGIIPFEEARDAIRENLTTSRIQSALFSYALELRETAEIQLYKREDSPESPSLQTDAPARTPESKTGNLNSDSRFPTFKETGLDSCPDDQGRPVIILFSASSCSHCQWVGGIFDFIAGEYADQGLITAHHYDLETGDDLLTEEVETKVPEEHLSIGKRGDPDGYLPYFNFDCRYDRIGTGYEEQNDLAAEAEEMSRVIEALLP